jgi:hypothetical protein
MSWWDSIVDFGSSVLDFAKENPTTAGAVAGGLYNASQGKNIIEGAGAGAILGYGAGQIFGSGGASDFIPGSGGSTTVAPSIAGAAGSAASSMGTWTPSVNTTTLAGIDAASGAVTQAATAGDFGNYGSKITDTLGDMAAWGKKNAPLAQLGIQGVSALYSMGQNEKLNKMRQDAVSRGEQVNARNDAVADAANADATAMSTVAANYDPRNLGVRAMADSYAAGGRDVAAIENNSTLSGAAKAALTTKAKVGASKNAVSGFQSGYDTGTKTQAGLYSTAGGLRKQYSGSGYDSTLAGDIAKSNNADSSNLTAMLENYLGSPSATLKKKQAEDQGVMQ